MSAFAAANALLPPIHDRMPAILDPELFDACSIPGDQSRK